MKEKNNWNNYLLGINCTIFLLSLTSLLKMYDGRKKYEIILDIGV